MKIQISLSSPELTQLEFSGENGLYSAVTPDEASLDIIVDYAKKFGFDIDRSKVHCTVMYSKTLEPSAGDISCDANKSYPAIITGVQHWDGHDEQGYLSLALESDALDREHKRLRKLGCTPTFDEYKPHITLWSGVKMSPALERKMQKAHPKGREILITLGNQFIGDLKDD